MDCTPTTTPPPDALYRSVWGRLVGARSVLLISPAKPDGDSVGSITGLYRALTRAGVRATMYCPDPVPPQFDAIPGVHDVSRVIASSHQSRHCESANGSPLASEQGELEGVRGSARKQSHPLQNFAVREIATSRTPRNDGGGFDVIVICDASDLPFTGVADDLPKWKAAGGTLMVMDHHRTNAMFGDVNLVVQGAPSTTQVIAAMLAANGVALDPETATCLLLGLVTDTDAFTNPAMSAAAAATASRLIGAGGRMGPILRAVYDSKPLGVLRLWGKAFQRIHVHSQYDFATTVLLPEDFVGLTEDEAERADGLSNFLQIVLPARAIMVLKDRGDGMVRGSLRTTRDDVDLGILAKRLGGGGHKKASGFGVPGRLVKHGIYWRVA